MIVGLKNGFENFELRRSRHLPRAQRQWCRQEWFAFVESHPSFCSVRRGNFPLVRKVLKKLEVLGSGVPLEGQKNGCFYGSLSLELEESLHC